MIGEHFPESVNDHARTERPFLTIPMGLVYIKANNKASRIAVQFARGLKIIKQNGTYMRIIKSYWGDLPVPKDALSEDMR
ncbi:MAG: hypothetical protein GY866_03880 [Proteobacteria bacterium]|nr:hypothetical protein [Pseudomonadota bacterium]